MSGVPQPLAGGYQPPPQQAQYSAVPTTAPGYTFHPMVTSYPVQQGTDMSAPPPPYPGVVQPPAGAGYGYGPPPPTEQRPYCKYWTPLVHVKVHNLELKYHAFRTVGCL